MNVLATGRAADILGERRILLSPKVREEALFIYADDARVQRQEINAEFLKREGVAFVAADLDDGERILAVRFAALVDDGEAEALAIALSRRTPILSDDLGAERIARSEGIPVESTLELVHSWGVGHDGGEVKRALVNLRARANYAPPRSHPLRPWFMREVEG